MQSIQAILIIINHDYNVVINPYSYHHIIMMLITLQNDCNGQVSPISEGIVETWVNLNLARVITWQHNTHRPRRHPEWQQFMTTIKESSRAHLTQVHVFHAYASADTLWMAHALSRVSSMRCGRLSSNSVTVKASKFAGSHKIPYAPVHNSNLLTEAKRSVLNWHRHWLPPWSSEYQIRPLLFLPIQHSPYFPNCPARSPIMPTFP
jgi:hypothetical protein